MTKAQMNAVKEGDVLRRAAPAYGRRIQPGDLVTVEAVNRFHDVVDSAILSGNWTLDSYTRENWEVVTRGEAQMYEGAKQMKAGNLKRAYDVRIFEKDAEGNTIGVLADERNVVAESQLAAERAVMVRAVKTDKISESTIYYVVVKEAE